MGCISCHDPHRMPQADQRIAYYRERCLRCHQDKACSLPVDVRLAKNKADDCIACHMPPFSTADITHTAATDHRVLRRLGKAGGALKTSLASKDVPDIAHFNQSASSFKDLAAARALGIAAIELVRVSEHPERERPRVQSALPLVEQALHTWPDDVAAWEARGNGLFVLDRYEDALASFEHVLSLAPQREQALVGAAAMARAVGHDELEFGYWQRALAVNPTSLQYRLGLANNLAKRKDWTNAVAECRKVLQQYPASMQARLLLAAYYRQHGDKASARIEFERFLALNPPNAEGLKRWFDAR